MESVLSSSESFAKALKGPQTSQTDKIALARQAWERTDVVLPHKQEFILEWLCTVLVRSATPTNKDATAMALVDAEYWRLLKDILAKVTQQFRQMKRLGLATSGRARVGGGGAMMSAGSGHALVDFQPPSILLRVPVIPMFTALIQRLAPASSTSSVNDSTIAPSKSKNKGKKGGAIQGEGATAKASPLEQRPSTLVLELASACFDLLLSTTMAEWFQPTLEQYTPLVHATLDTLTGMFPEPTSTIFTTDTSSNTQSFKSSSASSRYSQEDRAILVSFAGVALEHFKRLIAIQANQKKVFGLIAGKMFDDLVRARLSIRHLTATQQPAMMEEEDSNSVKVTARLRQSCQTCLDSIGAILRHGLFHQDHLQEYTTSLSIASSSGGANNDSEKAIQSYQKQLFDQIESIAKSEHVVAALDVLSVLLTYFIEESRRRQRMLASSGLDRSSGMDSTRSTEFKFFTELYTLAKNQLPELSSLSTTDGNKDHQLNDVERAVNVIHVLNQLLSTVADLHMYQSSNDNISKAQYAYLETCFRTMSKYLAKAGDLQNVALQTATLQGLVRLAQLDDLILEAHVERLWPNMLSPLPGHGPHATAKELASVLLETHGKSRQLGSFFSSLLKAARAFISTPEQLASSPILSRGFLDLIPGIVRLHLPLAQAPFILGEFVLELKSQVMTTGITLSEQQEDESLNAKKKKRKLNSGMGESADHESSSTRSAGITVALLVRFLKGLRITHTHQKQILNNFDSLFADFISPLVQEMIACTSRSQSKEFQERMLAPALQLHYALCKATTQYWEQALSTDVLVKLTHVMAKAAKSKTGIAVEDSVTLLLNRIVLQHVHLCLCSPRITMNETLTKTCHDLVEFTMTTSRLQELAADAKGSDDRAVMAQWDGLLLTAKGNSFLVASWQTQVNDWLDIVCRFGSQETMTLLADILTDNVLTSTVTDKEKVDIVKELTIQSLNQTLLRSANVYEVSRFRPVLVHAVLTKLIALLRGALQVDGGSKNKKEQTLMDMVEGMLKQQNQHSGPSYHDIVKAFAQWLTGELASTSSSSKKSKSASKKDVSLTVPKDRLLSLLSILHLLPLEYFDKRERDCILVLMGILDHSIQKHMQATDVAGMRSLLLCRKVSLAMMRWRNDAGLLATDPIAVMGLLTYADWNCTAARDGVMEDSQGLGKALWMTTSQMVQSLVHHAMLLATGSSQDDHASEQLIALLAMFQRWVEEDHVVDSATATVDEKLSSPRIRLCILSQACQAFTQSLEHLVATMAKKKKKAAGGSDGGAQAEYERRAEKAAKLTGRIQEVIHLVESKVLSHLSKTALKGITVMNEEVEMAMEVDDDNKEQEKVLLHACQASLDHFELLKTLLAFSTLIKTSQASQLTLLNAHSTAAKASKGSSKQQKTQQEVTPSLVDSQTFLLTLYQLADRLTVVLDDVKDAHGEDTLFKNMVHLVAILTSYTCEYIPTAGSSLSTQSSEGGDIPASLVIISEDQVKDLLMLILRVSEFGAITLVDMATLKDSYLAMLGHLPEDMFEQTLGHLLSDHAYSRDAKNLNRSRNELILVNLLEVTFLGAHQSQKRKVRKHLSKLLARMIRILQTSDSVEMVVEVLELLAGICSETVFELRPWEIGLILEAITTLMSPATPLLVGSKTTYQQQQNQLESPSNSGLSDGALLAAPQAQEEAAVLPQFTSKDAVRVFTGVYRVLTHIARFRQEELVELVPVFTAVLQAMFHGFKSLHPSIARKQQGIHALMASQNPFPLLTHRCIEKPSPGRGHSSSNDHKKQHDLQQSQSSSSLVTSEEPLPVECAENFARLLTTLGTKAVMSAGGSGGVSTDLEPPSTTVDGTTSVNQHQNRHHHHRGGPPLDTSKAFSKHAPYLLTEYFKIQSSVVASISLLPIRQALQPGLYALMDLCTEWERELMMANLDATGKSLLKGLYSDYLKYHKYTGR